MRYYELLEGVTTGEFTFGFELEAIYIDKNNDYDPEAISQNEFIEDVLQGKIESNGITGKIVSDSSIDTRGNYDIGFEFVSDPYSFNSKNLTAMFKTLKGLKNINVVTNSSCGFHVHVKYPSLSKDDMRWIIACVSDNDSYRDIVTQFKQYDFYNLEYASIEVLDVIQNAIIDKNDGDIVDNLDESKYNVLRIHPQGTLEWRGPRDFLNSNDESEIHDFIIHLFGYVRMISKCLDQKSVGSYSKKEFYNLFKSDNKSFTNEQIKFIKNYKGKDKEVVINLISKFPHFMDLTFGSPPRIYLDSNDPSIFKIEGDVIGGKWDINSHKVIYMSGNFGDAIWGAGYFHGNWTGDGMWITGVWMDGATYKGEEINVNPNTWEKALRYMDNNGE